MDCEHSQFWTTCLKLEVRMLTFVNFIRSGNFSQYKKAVKDFLLWLFTMNHILSHAITGSDQVSFFNGIGKRNSGTHKLNLMILLQAYHL